MAQKVKGRITNMLTEVRFHFLAKPAVITSTTCHKALVKYVLIKLP